MNYATVVLDVGTNFDFVSPYLLFSFLCKRVALTAAWRSNFSRVTLNREFDIVRRPNALGYHHL